MTLRRTLAAALLAAATALPLGVVALASAPAAAAAAAPSCMNPLYIPSRAEVMVVQWYGAFLSIHNDEACTNAGRFYWVDQLNAGVPREQVLAAIIKAGRGSDYNRESLGGLYRSYLGREPDVGAQYWLDGLNNGMPVEWIKQNLLASGEYASRFQSEAYYIDSLYRSILGRQTRNDSEIRYWSNRVRSIGRLNMVREIWYSAEAIDNRITRHYRTTLRRAPSAGELGYWRPFEAASDDYFPVRLAAVPEFESTYINYYQYGPNWK